MTVIVEPVSNKNNRAFIAKSAGLKPEPNLAAYTPDRSFLSWGRALEVISCFENFGYEGRESWCMN